MPTVMSRPRTHHSTPVHVRRRIWTTGIKVMGNLIPSLIALPPAAYGIWWMVSHGEVIGPGLWIFACSPVLAWLSMNLFGLHQNRRLKAEMATYLKGMRPNLKAPKYFVGAATPKYTSLVDPHEDIGFLILHPEKLEFFGDHVNLSIHKNDISSIEYRLNPHSIVGLGRWIAIDGRIGEQKIRFQVELREQPTLLGNMLRSSGLKSMLEDWLKKKEPRD